VSQACGHQKAAWVGSLPEAIAIDAIDRDQIGAVEATQTLGGEWPITELLTWDIGFDADVL